MWSCLLRLRLTACALLAVVSIAGCAEVLSPKENRIEPDHPFRIVVTIRPLELIVLGLIEPDDRELFEVTCLSPAAEIPENHVMTAEQEQAVARADLVISNGLGIDDWINPHAPEGDAFLRFADLTGVIPEQYAHDHGHSHDHGTHETDQVHAHEASSDLPPLNPYVWLSAERTRSLTQSVGYRMYTLLRRHMEAEALAERCFELSKLAIMEISTIDNVAFEALQPFQQGAVASNCDLLYWLLQRSGNETIVLHQSESGEPTPEQIAASAEAVRSRGIPAILCDPRFDMTLAQAVADEVGIPVVEIDPMGGKALTWAGMMRTLLERTAGSIGPAADFE